MSRRTFDDGLLVHKPPVRLRERRRSSEPTTIKLNHARVSLQAASASVAIMAREKKTEAAEQPGTSPEHAYEVIALQELWGLFSLVLFLLSLTTPYTARLLPPSIPGLGQLPPTPFLAFIAVPIFSSLGTLSALLAGRRRTATGRIGFFLNATVLVLSIVLTALAAVWFLVLR